MSSKAPSQVALEPSRNRTDDSEVDPFDSSLGTLSKADEERIEQLFS
jgi:hypothetical protein